jgi:DNA-binding NtrC family response regulator
MEVLLRSEWPGNIRQLENAIERACVTSRDEFIRPENLPPDLTRRPAARSPFAVDLSRPLPEQLETVVGVFEKRYLLRALRKARGHVGRAACIMGLSRRTLSVKIALYKVDTSEFKEE